MDTVVLYPAMGIGHLAPMAELAKLLTARGLAVSIVVLPPFPPSSSTSSLANFISGISHSHPSISFHHLPPSSPPSPHPNINYLYSFLRAANPHLRDLLSSLSRTSKIRALVLDLFCTHALDAAAEIGLPAYFFFTTAASILAAFLYLPTLHKDIKQKLIRNLEEAHINIPGLPLMLFSDFPESIQVPDDGFQTGVIDQFARFPEAKAILVNSIDFLEPRAIKTLSSGVCVPDRVTPPVYCVGPLITRGGGETHECLAWLDEQPKGSVVLLCFGSKGRFPAEQVKEIAVGLERSGQRFLWVVRSPPSPENESFFSDEPELELEVLLPVGFVERTKERGMVVKTWAPQVQVLNHEATGGFVTHCGWNSVMEGLCAGVGLIAWPLYAGQRMNKVVLVEEMELAVEMKGCDKGMVTAQEVETRVRWLMESEGGKEMRDRAKEVKERAATALRDGGSSHAALVELTGQWLVA